MDYKTRVIYVAILAVMITACDLLSVEKSPDYPFIIPEIELSTLEQMNSEFQAANNGHICSTLNEYGMTGFSRVLFPNDINPCLSKDYVRVELTVEDTLITHAKKTLLKNSEYTGVTDTSALNVIESIPLYGCTVCEGPGINNVPIEWKVTFDNQVTEDTEVENAEIVVIVDAKGTNRIIGNWYPDFRSPDLVNYGSGYAINSILGWQFDMRGYSGEEKIFRVEEENLGEPIKKIVPVEKENYLELRKCWVVSVDYDEGDFKGWKVIVDIIDGSLLQINPVM